MCWLLEPLGGSNTRVLVFCSMVLLMDAELGDLSQIYWLQVRRSWLREAGAAGARGANGAASENPGQQVIQTYYQGD